MGLIPIQRYERGCIIMGKGQYIFVVTRIFLFMSVLIADAITQKDEIRKQYSRATELMDSGNYEEAYEIFSSFNTNRSSYKDSLKLAEQCRLNMEYEKACKYAHEQDFLDVIVSFSRLGGFKDSLKQLKRNRDRLISYMTVVADAEESADILNTLIDHLLKDDKEATANGGE